MASGSTRTTSSPIPPAEPPEGPAASRHEPTPAEYAHLQRLFAQRSEERLEEIAAASHGDPDARLRILAFEVDLINGYAARIVEARDEAMLALREAGYTQAHIARLARVSDSYVSRRAIARGSKRLRNRVVGATSAVLVAAACVTAVSDNTPRQVATELVHRAPVAWSPGEDLRSRRDLVPEPVTYRSATAETPKV